MPGLYWKQEVEKSPWRYIETTPENMSAAKAAGAMFATWTEFEYEPGNGSGEPKRYGHVPLDFDDKQNPQNALDDMRTLCLVYLPEIHDVDANSIRFYASGLKGFHASIPNWVFGSENGHPYLPLIYKKIVAGFVSELKLKTLDMTLFCQGKGKMFRLPNVKRSTGTYKVPLTLDEVMTLDAEQLFKFTRQPRKIDPVDVDKIASESLKELYDSTVQIVENLQTSEAEPPLAADQLKQLRTMPAPCIKYILDQHPDKSEAFNFNRAVMLLVNFFQDIGASHDRAYRAVKSFLDTYPNSETYSTPKARLDHFNAQWQYMLKNTDYYFSCERAKGLQLPPEAYDCFRCLEKETASVTDDKAADDIIQPPDFPWQVMTGAAGKFANIYCEYTEAPEAFLFMSYLTVLGSIFAKRVCLDSEQDVTPRLFTLLVGRSSKDRKTTAIYKAIALFKRVSFGFEPCFGLGSAEGINRAINYQQEKVSDMSMDAPGLLLCYDEFLSFICKAGIKSSNLMQAVGSLYEKNNYANFTKDKAVTVEDCFLSLLAACTLETYESIYTPAFLNIGFPNRIFLVVAHAVKTISLPGNLSTDDFLELQSDIQRIEIEVGRFKRLVFTADAAECHHQWYFNRQHSEYSKRLDGYAKRLCLLLAINSSKSEIDLETVEAAIALVDWQLEIRKLFSPIDADTKVGQFEIKILNVLTQKGPSKKRVLLQYTNASRSGNLWAFGNALKNLKENGLVRLNPKTREFRVV